MSSIEQTQPLERPRGSIRRRILVGNGVVGVLLLIAAILIFWQVGRLLQAIDTFDVATERVEVVSEVRYETAELLSVVTRLLPLQNAALFSEEVGQILVDLEETEGKLQGLIAETDDPRVLSSLQRVSDHVTNVLNIGYTMINQALEEEWGSVRVRVGVLDRDSQQVANSVSLLLNLVNITRAEATANVAEARRDVILYPAIAALVAGTLAVFSMWQVTQSIAGPVEQLSAGAARLAAGAFDERVTVHSHDEMGHLADAFNGMAAQLEAYYSVLEARVAERTRDLALAADLGRRLARVRDLEILLNEAVEVIRDRFDLYYTQVYLTDPAERRLSLAAGTGQIGDELVERGHHLAVDNRSINGTAAIEREAVTIPDTQASGMFRPNPLLPDTRSEMAVPLLVGNRVVGVLDLQSSKPQGLTEESLPAFEVLAGLLATAIESAHLFAEAAAARAEIETRARQSTRRGWERFLNAIDRAESVGFAYEDYKLAPLVNVAPVPPTDNVLRTSIKTSNEQIGAIELAAFPEVHWTDRHIEVANRVAEQVAQQVENLRLLAEAEHYRDNAEQLVRRLTREGWEAYQQQGERVLAYRYTGKEVLSLSDGDLGKVPGTVQRPLMVRGEQIGQLAVAGDQAGVTPETDELLNVIAGRLSAQIETLRLSEQREAALSDVHRRSEELALINRVVTEITRILDLRESLEVVVRELVGNTQADQARVALLDDNGQSLTVVAENFDPSRSASALGTKIPVEGNQLTQEVLESQHWVMIEDAQHNPRTEPIHALFREQGIETVLILPIQAGNRTIGTVGIDILEKGKRFTEDELRLIQTLVFQAATAIQNGLLFEQVQDALALTEHLYEASEKINTAGSDFQNALAAMMEAAPLPVINRSILFLFDQVQGEMVETVEIIANWYSGEGTTPTPVGTQYNRTQLKAIALLNTEEPQMFANIEADERVDPATVAVFRQLNVQSAVIIPLWAGSRQMGALLMESEEVYPYAQSELEPYMALAGQVAVAIDRQLLVEATSRRAERERMINVIGQKIQSAPTVESALQVAITELGQALRARQAVVELDVAANGNGQK